MIVGYSLAHNQVFAPVFAESLGLLHKIAELGHIGSASEAMIGQKCQKVEFQKGGLMAKMDKILYDHLSKDYKYYVASIALANNTSLNFVTHAGYKKVLATDTRAYFQIDMKPASLTDDDFATTRPDGTVVRFRFATDEDIPGLTEINKDWLKENKTDFTHGYLAALFAENDWKYMIARKWVVLAEV